MPHNDRTQDPYGAEARDPRSREPIPAGPQRTYKANSGGVRGNAFFRDSKGNIQPLPESVGRDFRPFSNEPGFQNDNAPITLTQADLDAEAAKGDPFFEQRLGIELTPSEKLAVFSARQYAKSQRDTLTRMIDEEAASSEARKKEMGLLEKTKGNLKSQLDTLNSGGANKPSSIRVDRALEKSEIQNKMKEVNDKLVALANKQAEAAAGARKARTALSEIDAATSEEAIAANLAAARQASTGKEPPPYKGARFTDHETQAQYDLLLDAIEFEQAKEEPNEGRLRFLQARLDRFLMEKDPMFEGLAAAGAETEGDGGNPLGDAFSAAGDKIKNITGSLISRILAGGSGESSDSTPVGKRPIGQ